MYSSLRHGAVGLSAIFDCGISKYCSSTLRSLNESHLIFQNLFKRVHEIIIDHQRPGKRFVLVTTHIFLVQLLPACESFETGIEGNAKKEYHRSEPIVPDRRTHLNRARVLPCPRPILNATILKHD